MGRSGPGRPVAGVELARFAVGISGRLDEERYGRGLVADTQAMAWACLGNSYRVASDLRRAEEPLDEDPRLVPKPSQGQGPPAQDFNPGCGKPKIPPKV
jgi:hypothetical protein